ncbi:MAG: YdcF family protein [Rhodospirillaceae bacterium]|nr:YdcF family protein [Rhodospirillaceae bacterium]
MANLSHIVWTLLQPAHLLLLMLVAGWVLANFDGTRRLGHWFGGVATVLLVVIAIFPVGALLLGPLENRFPAPELPEHVDGIIVLGGGQNMMVTQSRGQVALNDNGERLLEAVGLFRRYPDAQHILTGGNGRRGMTEADVARLSFEVLGLETRAMLFEDRAANTHDNAVLTFEMIMPEPDEVWLLVTSAYHMPRSVGAFRQAGWNVVAYPVDYRTTGGAFGPLGPGLPGDLHDMTLAIHEYVGLLAYRLTGRMNSLFPAPR